MSSTAFFLIAVTLVVEFPVNHAYPAEDLWPANCTGRSYCHVQPKYYPNETINKLMENVTMNYELGDGDIEHRDGGQDVASCGKFRDMQKIYLIKDNNNKIRFVTQTEKFQIKIVVEECRDPGRVIKAQDLSKRELKTHRVDCTEKMVPFAFPVLSLDRTTLESEAPKDGISLSCSAKVIEQS